MQGWFSHIEHFKMILPEILANANMECFTEPVTYAMNHNNNVIVSLRYQV